MQQNKPSSNNSRDTDWQTLGELELPVGLSADAAINAWLIEILRPLDLQAEFQHKILKSAQDAAARILQAGMVEQEMDHIHLLAFAPGEHSSKPRTWGFFRIEKIESVTAGKKFPDHAIEFYLYLEGE